MRLPATPLTALFSLLLAVQVQAEPEPGFDPGSAAGLDQGTSAPAPGTIYRHVDANGKVVFTDQPPGNARKLEAITLPTINTIKAQPSAAPRTETGELQGLAPMPAAAPVSYQSVEIGGFDDGTVLRNPPEGMAVTVSAWSTPDLLPGDRMVIRHNGKTFDGSTYTLPALDRGAYTFSAAVLRDDQVMIESKPLTITIQRTTVQNQAANKPAPPPKPKPK